ncbi:MAG: transglutaminase-like domain-containing protein [Solirubrobacteraceae bacterium]
MSSFAAPPAPPVEPSSAPDPGAGRARLPTVEKPLLGLVVARALATAALGAFGALHWAGQLEPAPVGRMLALLGVALAAGVVVCRLSSARGLRVLAIFTAVALTTLAAFLIAGIPARQLAPGGWGGLSAEISRALVAIPSVRIPYAGVDPWIRWTVLVGGDLLLATGVTAALWPRGRGASRALALVSLGLLYAVPATASDLDAQFLRGLAFAVLLAAFVLLERVRVGSAGAAAGLAGAALLAGLLAALVLDREAPPIDYEAIAQSLGQESDPRFDWQHSYGPIRWTRDGREVLRVRARRSAYWKAENLDGFDGVRWTRTRVVGRQRADSELPDASLRRPEWGQRIRVRVTGMRTSELVGAGTTLDVLRSPRQAVPSGSPGTFVVGGELERGDAYFAQVYVPTPSAQELEEAGDEYPDSLAAYRTLELPDADAPSERDVPVTFPAFGSEPAIAPLALQPSGVATRTGAEVAAASVYGRSWALARRLASGASSPYAFVRRVEGYLGRGFRYTESPPERRVPLESFLFADREGYCQQFSGAMALLLRMGGVPARVATGFAPGTLDKRRGEYAVRDLDAHSWVEAWFPGYGWVTFDPTPSEAPASSQASTERTPSAAAPPRSNVPEPSAAAPRKAKGGNGGGGSWLLALGTALGAIAAGVAVLVARLGGRASGANPLLAELELALARTGRPVAPDTTLQALERRFAGSPEAMGYLRALRHARFGHDASGPSAHQRAGLRRELARGLGATGRLRALWALPPRVGRPRSVRPSP